MIWIMFSPGRETLKKETIAEINGGNENVKDHPGD